MIFRRSLIARAALVALAGPLLLPSAQAQDAPAAPAAAPASTLNRVEVTGSRIKRVDAETPAPVQVITREQIDRSGVTSVAEALKRLPAGNVGAFNENTVASFTPGAAGVSLRGLGAQATLVLIDGRRTAPYGLAANGQQTFVDVNTIPLEMVERIEVLLDGASAIYGSDAIGGVVNIILKKDYTGTQLAAGFGLTSRSDGQSKRLSFTVGRGSLAADNYNFFANITHEDQASVKASRRPNTRTADYSRFGLDDTRSEYSYPGNLYDYDTGDFISPMPGCTPVSDGSDLNGRCVLQRVRYADIQAKAQRDSLFLGGTLELSGGVELFGNLSVNHVKARLDDVGYSTATYASTGTLPYDVITLPPGHPSNPYPASLYPNGVDLRYRFADVPQSAEIEVGVAPLPRTVTC
jgi:iron complex outermembrane receptor protein